MTLADLPFGAPARVVHLGVCGELEAELMELGIVPGTAVRVVRAAPFGDPLEVDVAGARLALRRAVAGLVEVATARGQGDGGPPDPAGRPTAASGPAAAPSAA